MPMNQHNPTFSPSKPLTTVVRYTLLLITVLAFVLNSHQAIGQSKNISYSDQQWFQYFSRIQISTKGLILLDGGYRFRNSFSEPSLYILRAGYGINIGENATLQFRMAHLGFYNGQSWNKVEYRPSQELVVRHQAGKMKIKQRFMIEERYFNQKISEDSNVVSSFNFRFRYQIMTALKIGKLSNKKEGTGILLNIGNEVFLQAGKPIVYNVFDQNRLLLGFTFKLSPNLAISTIYNHQFRSVNIANSYKQDYVFWLGIRHSANLSSKSD